MKIKLLLSALIFLRICAGFSQDQAAGQSPPKAPRGYPNEALLKAAYALGMLKLIDKDPPVPGNLSVFKNIVYKRADTLSLMMDIYERQDLKKAVPVLIFIHGGGWSKGKRSDYLPYLIDYAEKGYVTVTVSYRLSKVAHFPAAVEDVKCAVRWIRTHASRYHIDPEHIALIGGSAGGHLALMVGYTDDSLFTAGCGDTVSARVQAVVDFYGPVDLTTEYARHRHECTSFIGQTYDEAPALYKAASPRFYISGDDPPTLIFQGTIDNLVPVSQSDSLQVWLDLAGVPNEYHRLKGWPHTMDIAKKVNAYCRYYMDRFFEKYL